MFRITMTVNEDEPNILLEAAEKSKEVDKILKLLKQNQCVSKFIKLSFLRLSRFHYIFFRMNQSKIKSLKTFDSLAKELIN